jgi:hypothetical protein
LEKLVQLAPPTSAVSDTPSHHKINTLLQTSLFQSILVTHFHHLENDNDDMDHHDPLVPVGGHTNNNTAHDKTSSSSSSIPGEQQQQQHHHHYEEEEDEEEESFDPPWPSEHEAFCALPLVQEHVVLEIASGLNSSGMTVKPMELPKGKVRVILPGSLRERGEFCLVVVAFMKDPYSYHHRADAYRWRVRTTRFQTLNEFL